MYFCVDSNGDCREACFRAIGKTLAEKGTGSIFRDLYLYCLV